MELWDTEQRREAMRSLTILTDIRDLMLKGTDERVDEALDVGYRIGALEMALGFHEMLDRENENKENEEGWR